MAKAVLTVLFANATAAHFFPRLSTRACIHASFLVTAMRLVTLMMDRLADDSRIQTQLIEDTSHEIRTPLAILATNAEVMLADPSPTLADYRNSTELTAKTVFRLRSTVEELLTGATFSNLKIRQTDNDLSVVAQRVADQCAEAAREAGISLVTNVPDQLLCAFDGHSVERALGNLLDNAIRFSPQNGVVTLTVGTKNDLALVSVEDLGAGIDTSRQGLVFDRYVSSAEPNSSNQGIGLAIVKQVADAHRGITIESPINGNAGTRFIMWFQL